MIHLPAAFDTFLFICETLGNISIVFVAFVTIRGLLFRKVVLSMGSFKIRRKDFTVQNITNIVSLKYYDGGEVPESVRKEILSLTCPATSPAEKKKKETASANSKATKKESNTANK